MLTLETITILSIFFYCLGYFKLLGNYLDFEILIEFTSKTIWKGLIEVKQLFIKITNIISIRKLRHAPCNKSNNAELDKARRERTDSPYRGSSPILSPIKKEKLLPTFVLFLIFLLCLLKDFFCTYFDSVYQTCAYI